MFDGCINDEKVIVRHYARGTTKESGDLLMTLTMDCFAFKDDFIYTVDCAGEWLKFRAKGSPYTVHVVTLKDSEVVFSANHTGDGLTFTFGNSKLLSTKLCEVMEVVRLSVTGLNKI